MNSGHLRIAYLETAQLPGGAAELASSAQAARGFVECGADIRLILRRTTRAPARAALEDATDVILPDVRDLVAPRLGTSLHLYFRRAYTKLLHGDRNALLFRDVAFAPWAARLRRRGMRVYFEAHDYWGDAEKERRPVGRGLRRRVRLAGRFLPLVDGIFCTSGPLVDLYRRRFPDLRIEVALAGTTFPQADSRREFSHLLGYFGSIDAMHPVEIVVRGLATSGTKQVRLLIVGARDEQERGRIEDLAAELGVSDRVEIHGWTLPGELEQHRARIDVGVVPLADTFEARTRTPLKLVDYLSASLPTIATRAANVTAYVTDGREAVLVNGSNHGWGEAIDRMYGGLEAYRTMAAQAHARARELTWTRRAARMLNTMHPGGRG